MKRTRIILADNHQLLLDGLRKLLEPSFEIVGTFTDGEALVERAESLLPDIVILEVTAPRINGLRACGQIKRLLPETRIIFLTMNQDIEMAGEAFRAGASGYVLKTSRASELLTAISEVLRNRYFATPSLTDGMIDSFVRNAKTVKKRAPITNRQKEVLQLLVEGCTLKQVANILNITPSTVAFHKYTMMDHLKIQSSAELISYAMKARSWAHPGTVRV